MKPNHFRFMFSSPHIRRIYNLGSRHNLLCKNARVGVCQEEGRHIYVDIIS